MELSNDATNAKTDQIKATRLSIVKAGRFLHCNQNAGEGEESLRLLNPLPLSSLHLPQSEVFYLFAKRDTRNIEYLRSLGNISPGTAEHVRYVVTFDFTKGLELRRHEIRPYSVPHGRLNALLAYYCTSGQQQCARQHVVEFPNIARPVVLLATPERGLTNSLNIAV